MKVPQFPVVLHQALTLAELDAATLEEEDCTAELELGSTASEELETLTLDESGTAFALELEACASEDPSPPVPDELENASAQETGTTALDSPEADSEKDDDEVPSPPDPAFVVESSHPNAKNAIVEASRTRLPNIGTLQSKFIRI